MLNLIAPRNDCGLVLSHGELLALDRHTFLVRSCRISHVSLGIASLIRSCTLLLLSHHGWCLLILIIQTWIGSGLRRNFIIFKRSLPLRRVSSWHVSITVLVDMGQLITTSEPRLALQRVASIIQRVLDTFLVLNDLQWVNYLLWFTTWNSFWDIALLYPFVLICLDVDADHASLPLRRSLLCWFVWMPLSIRIGDWEATTHIYLKVVTVHSELPRPRLLLLIVIIRLEHQFDLFECKLWYDYFLAVVFTVKLITFLIISFHSCVGGSFCAAALTRVEHVWQVLQCNRVFCCLVIYDLILAFLDRCSLIVTLLYLFHGFTAAQLDCYTASLAFKVQLVLKARFDTFFLATMVCALEFWLVLPSLAYFGPVKTAVRCCFIELGLLIILLVEGRKILAFTVSLVTCINYSLRHILSKFTALRAS